jgi:hypothetical protein
VIGTARAIAATNSGIAIVKSATASVAEPATGTLIGVQHNGSATGPGAEQQVKTNTEQATGKEMVRSDFGAGKNDNSILGGAWFVFGYRSKCYAD